MEMWNVFGELGVASLQLTVVIIEMDMVEIRVVSAEKCCFVVLNDARFWRPK